MANIFKLTQGYAEKPKRNVYDLSFSNNITANFGTLYPVFCKEVNPGDSMKIDTSFGLRAQPMIFPIQTRMRADIHYFYVRNRTLWKDWMDFYGKTKENLVHPYIEQPISSFKTKSIYDYLGIPTSFVSDGIGFGYYSVNPWNIFNTRQDTSNSVVDFLRAEVTSLNITNPLIPRFNRLDKELSVVNSLPLYYPSSGVSFGSSFFASIAKTEQPSYKRLAFALSPISVESFNVPELALSGDLVTFTFPSGYLFDSVSANDESSIVMFYAMKSSQDNQSIFTREILNSGYYLSNTGSSSGYIPLSTNALGQLYISGTVIQGYSSALPFGVGGYDLVLPVVVISTNSKHLTSFTTGASGLGGYYSLSPVIIPANTDSSELNYLPWCGSNKQLKINALPYRAYEAIYNSFYRNVQNDPFKINGVNEYNKFVTNQEGGADSFNYRLYQRNWQLDFLTSAVQSPQQGLVPLVGVTVNNANSTATFKFQSETLNNGQPITATASVSDDGDVVGLQYYDPDLPQSNIDRLMQAINYGISINDIRQTNSLQRWLEKNIRRGYRYRDQLQSHFGVSVSYNELLMPEFIGGVSQDVETQTIFQTVTNENGYLGDYAGRGSVVGNSRNSVSKYCDEAGFIIGIMSIVPIPVYSQVPAGYAFKSNLMDYYFPEFGKIGMQPIYNYHVTPLQTSPTQLNDVFGYQRPWWDLISSIDEVHGEFRGSASGYLIHRQFEETPVLNGNFLKIDNRYINDVFAITDTEVSDQFLGVLNFHVTKKTSIPLHGEPSIE